MHKVSGINLIRSSKQFFFDTDNDLRRSSGIVTVKVSSRFNLLDMSSIKERALPFVREVLHEVADFIELVNGGPPGYQSAFRTGGSGYVAELQKMASLRKKREALAYLKRKQMFEERKIGDSIRGSLTDKGWELVLSDRIRTCTRMNSSGTISAIIFDIPERTRNARDAFRDQLKDWGFRQFQKSIWITTKDVSNEIAEYIELTGASSWIRVLRGELISASHERISNDSA